MSDAAPAAPATPTARPARLKWLLAVVGISIVLCLIFAPGLFKEQTNGEAQSTAADDSAKLELVGGDVHVPPDVVKKMGLKTAEVVAYTVPRRLKLDGTLFADPSYLVRIHSRFAGEIVELGPAEADNKEPKSPRIHFGGHVKKGQLLAVVWCKDLGEKKSELVDALLKWRLDVEVLKRIQKLAEQGATPEQKVRDAEHNRDSDWIAVTRARRTLASWRLSEDEINAIEKEADAIQQGKTGSGTQTEQQWARVDVLSPIDGVVVEVNCNKGDIIDTTVDLFKVADVSRLRVLCNAFEEDLPLLQELQPDQRRWTVQLGTDREGKALPGSGGFDQIGRIIDPNQHTAQVLGWVDNPGEHLLIGQFVTALVELPPLKNVVAVPATAVIEGGEKSQVFVRQGTGDDWRFEQRLVALVGQDAKAAQIVSHPSQEQLKRGIKPLEPGEFVATDGVLELSGALEDLQAAAEQKTK